MASAAGQAGCGVQDAQALGLGFGGCVVQGEELEPGEQGRGGQPGGVEREVVPGEPADPAGTEAAQRSGETVLMAGVGFGKRLVQPDFRLDFN